VLPARSGAVIGVVDADWDGELLFPPSETLRRSTELARKLRQGTSPCVGKQLRHLLVAAGFDRAEGYVRAGSHGTAEEARSVGSFHASLLGYPAVIQRAVSHGWASEQELAEMSQAWLALGEEPGAFLVRFWCEAIAWA
jgi:hypothetical protein